MTIISRKPGVTSEVVDAQAVLIAPSGEEIIELNSVGTVIWEALATPSDVDAIAAHVLSVFEGAPADDVRQDVVDFLNELRSADLIDGDPSA